MPPPAPGLFLSWRKIIPGLLLAAMLALLAKLLAAQVAHGVAGIPKLPISPVLCAVLLGMLWRNTLGLPAWSERGLDWTMKVVLRVGIALVGLRLTLAGASAVAGTAIPVVLACITTALVSSVLIARALGIEKRLATLLAVGTAVCGCTAVIALSPAIRARGVETAFAVACVVLFGSIAMVCYPLVAAYFFADAPMHAGIFLGTAIHDTSQVVGAGLIYSQQANAPEALAAASLTKLLRNLSMAVLIPAAAWWMHRQTQDSDGGPVKTRFSQVMPFFVLAFIGCIVLRSVGDAMFVGGGGAAAWEALVSAGQGISDLLLVCALAAVGLSVSFMQLREVGWRPLASGFALAMLVGACSLGMTLLLL
jgi:uncharacterized integral membrane protein (TIGR00698 family)